MTPTILTQLHNIESSMNVRILLAVESGSRAWGFASPDSDYDVRFVYARPEEDYLRLEEVRDVIELPIDDALDINGWDLNKTLRLIYKGNPTIFEWMSSPIVYIDSDYAEKLRVATRDYFFRKGALYHYVSMAEGNYREYLKGDMVRAKKYFYVLRPVLACRWILDRGTPPPMAFGELMEAELPDELRSTVEELLDIKMNSPEVKLIPRIVVLNDYLDRSITEIKGDISQLDDEKHGGWDRLNELFLEGIREK